MDQEYSQLEFELHKTYSEFIHPKSAYTSKTQVSAAVKRLNVEFKKLNYLLLEKRHAKTFLFWLLDKYLGQPLEVQLEFLLKLHCIGYKFVQKNTSGDSIYSYFARHDRAVDLFNAYFTHFPPHLVEHDDPGHPLLMPALNDELFRFLVAKYDKYNSPELIPLLFAILIQIPSCYPLLIYFHQ